MKKVITPVGTSLFANYRKNISENENSNKYIRYFEENQTPYSQWENNIGRIECIKKLVFEWANNQPNVSAEIDSLIKISEKHREEIEVILIATDTILSVLAAELIIKLIANKMTVHFERSSHIIKGLQVKDGIRFQKSGLNDLIKFIQNYIYCYLAENILINITAGYKAVIPYLTIMGQLNNIPLCYNFEHTDELITIPQTPISVNWGIFEKYSSVMEDLSKGIYEWGKYQSEKKIQDDIFSCIWIDEDLAELSVIGRIFWHHYRNYFYVRVEKGSDFFSENKGNKNQIYNSIKELYQRLMAIMNNKKYSTEKLVSSIQDLGEKNDLRHGQNPAKNKFIFKSTKTDQIRLVYSPVVINGNIKIKLFDYVRGNFNHNSYITDFNKKWKNRTEIEFIDIPILKPRT